MCFCFLKSRQFRAFAASQGVDTKVFDVELGPEPEEINKTQIDFQDYDFRPVPDNPSNSITTPDTENQ